MTINGLPLHPLIVHATVATLPIFALVTLGYQRPRWQQALRWPLGALGVLSAFLVWLTSASGDALNHDRFATATGELAQRIHHHEDLAGKLAVVTYVVAALAVLEALLRGRVPTIVTRIGAVLLVLGAIAIVVLAVLTGDAGAQAVWHS